MQVVHCIYISNNERRVPLFTTRYAISPDDFALQINDRISSAIQYQVKEACKRHKQNVKMYRVKPIDIAFLVDMLPVVVRDQHGYFYHYFLSNL